ncbi:MAG: hypothetical protein P1V51_13720 [Deltaproteobacteria bacterium]|nr:hypothetical protein [Deltaproteobacteria bacterium]
MTLPKCGLYKTTAEIEGVPAGRLVYFHNHGDPGPGIYLPEGWEFNRARFQQQGRTLAEDEQAEDLEAVLPEGLYRVLETFTCCENDCRTFEAGLLVQVGYNGEAQPILFVPEWTERGLAFPMQGQPLDPGRLAKLEELKVAHRHVHGSDDTH